jgi:signal transduction histidine kinase
MTLASLSWSLRALAYFGSPIRIPPMWFEQFNPLNVLLTALAMCAATLSTIVVRKQSFERGRVTDWRRTPRRVMVFMLVSGCAAFVVAEAVGSGAWFARAYAQLCALLLSLWTLWWVWSGRLRMGRWHRAGILAGYLGLVGCAVHDMGIVTGHISPTGPSYLFWGFVALLVIYAVISGDYIISTLNRAENSNQELEQRMAEKTAALEQSYAQLRQSELATARQSARQQERERLLRDMHDGLGAQLMTALRGVERGALGRDQIAQSLLDGLDELRMLMDSADMGADLSAALAAWRNRWDARLGAVDVQLHWELDDSMDDVVLSSDQLLQVMRVLQESATNVVKHAQARNMHVQVRVEGQAPGPQVLLFALQDDGQGLAAPDGTPGHRGLRNMRHRAETIGAMLEVGNRPAPERGCCVVLRVPLPATLPGQAVPGAAVASAASVAGPSALS